MIQISKPLISDKDMADVVEVMRSGMIVQGPKVLELEGIFKEYCGVKHAIAVNSGTAGLHAALNAMGVVSGDEVITSPFTFVATANAILMCGAVPVFADIDPDTFSLAPHAVASKISKKTKIILPVSLYGLPYDQKIDEIAISNGIKVLDDAAQSIGATRGTKKSGTFADMTVFSLYATKNVMCGEGGMIVTDDDKYAESCRMFRHHGQSEKTRYEYFGLGYNYRMSDLHAAIGINQIRQVSDFTNRRQKNAERLSSGLRKLPGIILPSLASDRTHSFHQYTIRVTQDFPLNRDQLKEHLYRNGVATAVYYPKPLHLCNHLSLNIYTEGHFPVAEKCCKEVLSLPVHPSLEERDIDHIINSITGCV